MNIATHPNPIWRDRADFIVMADLQDHDMPGRAEQLWARQVGPERFEICCIPFFTYGICLGDIVATREQPDWRYVVDRVDQKSGRRVVRGAFAGEVSPSLHETLHDALVRLSILHEWFRVGYVACSIETDEEQQSVLDLMRPYEELDKVFIEWFA